ncbi:alpha/beta hydrolase [Agromyces protaetiae]|uniref:Alpha/beta hydrolase n=1 Tax=Agromyces protaetiae TaxID=2509455 RepID=A0A4P6FDS9_9MICO|nr:alpha/beta hydrolase [Agromyces protaetiae]QAY74360.1 alpha/beta hydrolase [Agromyces protaetiae]
MSRRNALLLCTGLAWAGAVAVTACAGSGGAQREASGPLATSDPALTATPTPRPDVDGLVALGDGRSVFATCAGEGSPTVVLISGKGNGAEDWHDVLAPDDPAHDSSGDDLPWGLGELGPSEDAVFPQVARFARVCAYDRPDIRSGSDATTPRPQPHTVDDDVDDLAALLAALDEPGPYVLVPHSYGGLIALLYARTHPDDVAGLVLDDAASPLIADVADATALANWDASNATTSPQLREGVEVLDAFARIDAAPPLPDVPAVVLTADKPWRTDLLPPDVAAVPTVTFDDWLEASALLADALDAPHLTETDSGHDIHLYDPALVVEQIRLVVDEARLGALLPSE